MKDSAAHRAPSGSALDSVAVTTSPRVPTPAGRKLVSQEAPYAVQS